VKCHNDSRQSFRNTIQYQQNRNHCETANSHTQNTESMITLIAIVLAARAWRV